MMAFWEENHYFGPDGTHKIALANDLIENKLTRFAEWANAHMSPGQRHSLSRPEASLKASIFVYFIYTLV
jgi:hypothetical protein